MDGFNEKKWFVYIADHHEGPFSLAEMQAKMDQGEISTQHYVWSEGMTDWKPMSQIQAFESLAPARPAIAAPTAVPANEAHTSPNLSIALEAAPTPQLAMATPVASPGITIQSVEKRTPVEEAATPAKKSSGGGWIGTAMTLTVLMALGAGGFWAHQNGHLDPITDAAQPYLLQLAEKVPALQPYISPIPKLTDVQPEEFTELREAAAQPIAQGPAIAIALAQSNLETPEFYVASNLPDGTTVDISLEGVSDTLLNQLSFGSKLQVTLNKKLAKSQAVRFSDGRPMPRGQYRLQVAAGQTKTQKSYFLGGAKDATYTQRLKEFHDRLMEKSKAELTEIEQFTMTLEAQLASTRSQFDSARRKKAAGKKDWAAFEKSWKSFNEKLGETFTKWTPSALQSEYFHGSLYAHILIAAQTIERVHASQSAFMKNPKADPKSFEIQVGEAVSVAQNTLAALKSKLEKVKNTPPTPNGMPQREATL